MLSATVFISLVLTYTNRNSISLKCVSDNQELINRMNDHKDYEFPFPNETTKSEFDITEQIFRTTKAYNITADYEWVRGHQDRHKEYEKLDTYAKLNVQADRLAGDYQDRKGAFRPLAPVLPSCPAMIFIRGISVTSNIFKQLV